MAERSAILDKNASSSEGNEMKKLAVEQQVLVVIALDNWIPNEARTRAAVRAIADSMRGSAVDVWITSALESAVLVDATADVTESEASAKDFKIGAAEMIYDREESIKLRAEVIRLRNNYLANNMFSEAVILSHVVAWMHAMMEAVSV